MVVFIGVPFTGDILNANESNPFIFAILYPHLYHTRNQHADSRGWATALDLHLGYCPCTALGQ